MIGARPAAFRYVGVEVDAAARTITCDYEVQGARFTERATFDEDVDLAAPGVEAAATLYFLTAGLSYYKTTAAPAVEVAPRLGEATRSLLAALLDEGLGEFRHRNGLHGDVALPGASVVTAQPASRSTRGALIPFGGGIDSLVTVARIHDDDAVLFEVHPAAGRFAAIGRAAVPTGRRLVRCSRALDRRLLDGNPAWYHGHVPVTMIVSSLAVITALGLGRSEVLMSNERSASAPTLVDAGRAINHQWAKSLAAERLFAAALAELVDGGPHYRSVLRDRSELWIAREFSTHPEFFSSFLSCNRAFRQDPAARATTWCGECDKCLFTDLVLAPFLARTTLEEIFGGHEPIADAARIEELEVLAGLGSTPRPWECVGDADECAAALVAAAARADRADQPHLAALAARCAAPPLATFLDATDEEAVRAAPDRL